MSTNRNHEWLDLADFADVTVFTEPAPRWRVRLDEHGWDLIFHTPPAANDTTNHQQEIK